MPIKGPITSKQATGTNQLHKTYPEDFENAELVDDILEPVWPLITLSPVALLVSENKSASALLWSPVPSEIDRKQH